jgi:hypothetical protein
MEQFAIPQLGFHYPPRNNPRVYQADERLTRVRHICNDKTGF